MKIGYFADGPWSHKAFELIAADPSLEVRFIVPRKDSQDSVLINLAKRYGIDYLENVSVNSAEFHDKAQSFHCDLFVSMSYNQIFKQKIATMPSLGTINCHAGKLPFYRGRNILNWVLINDEKEFGITVHYIDNTIDTGDIILQRVFLISDEDDYNSLLDRAYTGCAQILYDSIKLIEKGSVQRVAQRSIHPVGSYFGIRIEGDEIINWNQDSRQIFNFIRAICRPGPRAKTFCRGQEVLVNKAAFVPLAPNYTCINGMVTGITDRGYHVKTADNLIEIYDVETECKLKTGDRFQCKP